MGQLTESIQFLLSFHSLSPSVFCQPFPPFLMSSSTWLNHHVLDYSMGLLPLRYNYNNLSISLFYPLFLRCKTTVDVSLLILSTNFGYKLLLDRFNLYLSLFFLCTFQLFYIYCSETAFISLCKDPYLRPSHGPGS